MRAGLTGMVYRQGGRYTPVMLRTSLTTIKEFTEESRLSLPRLRRQSGHSFVVFV